MVYLLASLPHSYNVLVTALEANEDVPKLAVVTERILRKDKSEAPSSAESAMTSRKSFKKVPKKCDYCGHIKRFCRDLIREKRSHGQQKATTQEDSDSEDSALLVSHKSVSCSLEHCKWIIDSGATCHMSFESKLFTTVKRAYRCGVGRRTSTYSHRKGGRRTRHALTQWCSYLMGSRNRAIETVQPY